MVLFVRLIARERSGREFSQIRKEEGILTYATETLTFCNKLIYHQIFDGKNLASNMHFFQAIAVSESTTPRGENNMKKLVTTLTALAFALGLTASGFAQTTTVKEGEKPAVKTQTPASTPQVIPADKDKCKAKEAGKPVTKESDPAKGKKPETLMSKKDNGKKPVAPAPDPKKEETKNVTK